MLQTWPNRGLYQHSHRRESNATGVVAIPSLVALLASKASQAVANFISVGTPGP